MNVLILAAAHSATGSEPQHYPTWLEDREGILLLERQVASFHELAPRKFIFMFHAEDVEKYYLTDIVGQMVPNGAVLQVRRETAGAACTAMLAQGEIDLDRELVIASATDQIDVNYVDAIGSFRQRGADAGVLTFPALHPRYAFVRVDSDGWVIESSEKRPISRTASAGLYWFKKASDFFAGAREMILKDANVQGRFYICPVLNELILRHAKIATYQLSQEQYHPLKSNKQVDNFQTYLNDQRAL